MKLDFSFFPPDFKIEPWFGSHYSVDDIAPSLMDLWRDPPEIDASLHLPAKNQFIPCDFSIRASKVCNNLPLEYSPICILDEPLMKFWYKLDNSFKLPRANTYFHINLSGGYSSVKNYLLTELFVLLLKDKLNEIIYQVNHLCLNHLVILYFYIPGYFVGEAEGLSSIYGPGLKCGCLFLLRLYLPIVVNVRNHHNNTLIINRKTRVSALVYLLNV